MSRTKGSKSKAIAVGSLVMFYNGWMWSRGQIKEVTTINSGNRNKYPANFKSGQRAYSIVSRFNGHCYSPVSRADISKVIAK